MAKTKKFNTAAATERLDKAFESLVSGENTADAIACHLARKKVIGKCGSAKHCVLAQYFANAGRCIVTVAGNIAAYKSEADYENDEPFWSANTTKALDALIEGFDGHQYPFLIQRTARRA